MAKEIIPAGACPVTRQVGQHVSSCWKVALNCGQYEHSHVSGCYKRDGQLKCTLKEHTHSAAAPCYVPTGPICGGVG